VARADPYQQDDNSDWISRQNNGGANDQYRDREPKILSASEAYCFERGEHKHQ
jgi:hypothetical protein